MLVNTTRFGSNWCQSETGETERIDPAFGSLPPNTVYIIE